MRKKLVTKTEKKANSLKLAKETLANLNSSELQNAKGGSVASCHSRCAPNSGCCAF
jgi:natural product precursor